MIICKTPFRISFFGGGTDFPQWYNNHKGMVISSTINQYCYVTIKNLNSTFDYKYKLKYFKNEFINEINKIKHPSIKAIFNLYHFSNNPLELSHSGDLPAQSGLGASSAFSVSLLNAIHTYNNIKIDNKKLSKLAINLEQKILKEYVGSQDQIACTNGGFNIIKFSEKNIKINNIFNKKDIINKIENSSVLFFTGMIRNSQEIEKEKIKRLKSNSLNLKHIYEIAQEAEQIINKNNNNLIYDLSKLLDETWKLKKTLSKKVTNHKIENLYNYAKKNGALAGKLLGAGSGGFMIFLVDNKKNKDKLIKSLIKFQNVNFKFENYGTRIIYNKK